MAYYLGIDGGGTKTRCLLADETSLLAKSMTGGSNMVRLGEMQTRESVHAAISQVCTSAKISPDKIHAICIGAAGAARPDIHAKIRNILAELVPGITSALIEVVGDTEIAHEAAFGAGPGVIAIAGTGSVAYGRDASRHTARAGGWGFAVSDEGSGQWIGRNAISAILNASDRGRETALTALVLRAWKLDTLHELVQQANSTPPPDFPRLLPSVLRAADEHDAAARELLQDAGVRLASLVEVVIRRLSSGDGVADAAHMLPAAVTGSVFRQSAIVRDVFYNTLQNKFPGIDVRLDPVDPVQGALARARRIGVRI